MSANGFNSLTRDTLILPLMDFYKWGEDGLSQFPDAGHIVPAFSLCRDFDSYLRMTAGFVWWIGSFQFPDAGHTVPALFVGILILTKWMQQQILADPALFQFPDAGYIVPALFAGILILTGLGD